jgi:hypothetical protein
MVRHADDTYNSMGSAHLRLGKGVGFVTLFFLAGMAAHPWVPKRRKSPPTGDGATAVVSGACAIPRDDRGHLQNGSCTPCQSIRKIWRTTTYSISTSLSVTRRKGPVRGSHGRLDHQIFRTSCQEHVPPLGEQMSSAGRFLFPLSDKLRDSELAYL